MTMATASTRKIQTVVPRVSDAMVPRACVPCSSKRHSGPEAIESDAIAVSAVPNAHVAARARSSAAPGAVSENVAK